jgi:predicted TIM-barrel fold metal-dependent hydrolase
MMIIDCHCHAGTGDGLRGPWDTEARIDRHLSRARRAGITKTVVFPVFNSDYARANERLAAIVRARPNELIGFGAVDPVRDAGRIEGIVARAVTKLGFRGLKVHGHDALPTREVCSAARRYRLPILVDIVGQVAVSEMLASQYPDVNFIIAHLGGFADNWMTYLHVVDQLCRYPNLYADTSGVRYFDALVTAVRRAGPHKLIFGSDGPLLHPELELHKIHLLKVRPEAEALILGRNIARLLSPSRRPLRTQIAQPSRW